MASPFMRNREPAMDDAPRIRSVLVAGGGVEAWLTAAALARALPAPRYAIQVLDLHDLDEGPEGVGDAMASLPALRGLHAQIGLDEDLLFQQARATVSLGAEVRDWSRIGARYFHPFGDFGASLDGVAFHNYWLRLQDHEDAGPFEDYALAAVAARLGRFAPPSDDPNSILSTFTYACHWETAAYGELLRARAGRLGVQRVEGDIADIRFGEREGFIEGVVLTDGRTLQADLYVDASGPRAALAGANPQGAFEDWRRWLPCDRTLATATTGDEAPVPFMTLQANAAGWTRRIPLQGGDGRDVTWSSAHMDQTEAERILTMDLDGARHELRAGAFVSGRRDRPWIGNCVALGGAACVLPPAAPVALQLVQSGIWALLDLFPDRDFHADERDEYNRVMIETMERMRDFVILRQHATSRAGSPFWSYCAGMDVPEFLDYRVRLFRARGRLLLRGETLFGESDWSAVHLGQERPPRAYEALADTPPDALVKQQLAAIRRAVAAAAVAMPSHTAYLQQRRQGA